MDLITTAYAGSQRRKARGLLSFQLDPGGGKTLRDWKPHLLGIERPRVALPTDVVSMESEGSWPPTFSGLGLTAAEKKAVAAEKKRLAAEAKAAKTAAAAQAITNQILSYAAEIGFPADQLPAIIHALGPKVVLARMKALAQKQAKAKLAQAPATYYAGGTPLPAAPTEAFAPVPPPTQAAAEIYPSGAGFPAPAPSYDPGASTQEVYEDTAGGASMEAETPEMREAVSMPEGEVEGEAGFAEGEDLGGLQAYPETLNLHPTEIIPDVYGMGFFGLGAAPKLKARRKAAAVRPVWSASLKKSVLVRSRVAAVKKAAKQRVMERIKARVAVRKPAQQESRNVLLPRQRQAGGSRLFPINRTLLVGPVQERTDRPVETGDAPVHYARTQGQEFQVRAAPRDMMEAPEAPIEGSEMAPAAFEPQAEPESALLGLGFMGDPLKDGFMETRVRPGAGVSHEGVKAFEELTMDTAGGDELFEPVEEDVEEQQAAEKIDDANRPPMLAEAEKLSYPYKLGEGQWPRARSFKGSRVEIFDPSVVPLTSGDVVGFQHAQRVDFLDPMQAAPGLGGFSGLGQLPTLNEMLLLPLTNSIAALTQREIALQNQSAPAWDSLLLNYGKVRDEINTAYSTFKSSTAPLSILDTATLAGKIAIYKAALDAAVKASAPPKPRPAPSPVIQVVKELPKAVVETVKTPYGIIVLAAGGLALGLLFYLRSKQK